MGGTHTAIMSLSSILVGSVGCVYMPCAILPRYATHSAQSLRHFSWRRSFGRLMFILSVWCSRIVVKVVRLSRRNCSNRLYQLVPLVTNRFCHAIVFLIFFILVTQFVGLHYHRLLSVYDFLWLCINGIAKN